MQVHNPTVPVIGWPAATARLACVLAGVGLVTTRLGLIAHEFVGHGAAALAVGGSVEKVRLFWFAGGWIDYDLPRQAGLGSRVIVSLGGIALELVVGLTLWIALASRTSLAGRITRATGAAIAIHAAWYLAVGTYHGFGDGVVVRHAAKEGRYVIALAAGAAVLALAFVAARSILGILAATLPGSRRAQIAGVLLAATVAGGLQAGLAIGEVRMRRDDVYGSVMQPQRERVVAQELARWERAQRQRGAEIDAAARRARAAELAAKHRELPFAAILGVLTVLAIAAGAWRARPGTAAPLPPSLLYKVCAFAVGSIALVIAIDAVFA
jgi:hypothetical protein